MSCIYKYFIAVALIFCFACDQGKQESNSGWQALLDYTLKLHQESTHPAEYPFDRPWEEIGPGYCYGPAFGHWDIVHQVFDALVYDPQHAIDQLYNNIQNQTPYGMIPGSFWFPNKALNRPKVRWNSERGLAGHPPVWVVAVDEYVQQTGNKEVLKDFFPALIRQLTWFENARKADDEEGYYYNDILNHRWESGVDEGIRFYNVELGKKACVDATCHVYQLYVYASKWAKELGVDEAFYTDQKNDLARYINEKLYDKHVKSYFDSWAVNEPKQQHLVFENFWPLIVGACPKERADYLIDEFMLNPKHFLSEHPLTTVSMSDPNFEIRMWRGPAWNSMTFWAVKGCIKYERYDAAKLILKKALDCSARQFDKTGTIWEFYHPHGGDQMEVTRKPHTQFNIPCRDYLGHDPFIAMAELYYQIKDK